MSVWGKIAGKRKTFLSLLCDGVPPYDACRKVWPKLKDVHGHVARIFNDQEFKSVYSRLTDHQSNRETLLSDCRRILDSPECKPGDRLIALKVMAMIKGYMANAGRPTAKGKLQRQPELDPALLNKMADLGRKAYDDKRRN